MIFYINWVMKKIKFTKAFEKSFKKRILPYPNLSKKFAVRMRIFQDDARNPLLRSHALVGSKVGKRAFSVGGDLRVIYTEDENSIIFYDVGSHNQVY